MKTNAEALNYALAAAGITAADIKDYSDLLGNPTPADAALKRFVEHRTDPSANQLAWRIYAAVNFYQSCTASRGAELGMFAPVSASDIRSAASWTAKSVMRMIAVHSTASTSLPAFDVDHTKYEPAYGEVSVNSHERYRLVRGNLRLAGAALRAKLGL